MAIEDIIEQVKREVEKLNRVLLLLTRGTNKAPRGKMSAEGRKRISLAQKRGGKRSRRAREEDRVTTLILEEGLKQG